MEMLNNAYKQLNAYKIWLMGDVQEFNSKVKREGVTRDDSEHDYGSSMWQYNLLHY
jgi:hypothetical protein